jgi:hypothetical protein
MKRFLSSTRIPASKHQPANNTVMQNDKNGRIHLKTSKQFATKQRKSTCITNSALGRSRLSFAEYSPHLAPHHPKKGTRRTRQQCTQPMSGHPANQRRTVRWEASYATCNKDCALLCPMCNKGFRVLFATQIPGFDSDMP